MTKRLIILRHAQAEHNLGGADRDRTLTPKGRAQARAAGSLLAQRGLVPDHVICSAARRTDETLDLVLRELPTKPTVDHEEAAYNADADTILDLIHRVAPTVETLMVVGHNPAMAQLAADLTEEEDGPTFVAFAPASIAVAELEVEWLYAAPGTGTGYLLT